MNKKPEDVLKEARERQRLTQADMAKRLGISHRMYQNIESGAFPKFKSDTVQKIDAMLGTSLYEMIYEKVSRENVVVNDSQPHYGTLPDYREKYIQSLERENSRLRADLEAIREKVLISLKGLSESERLILAMLKASLQLDVEREAKGDRKKLKDLQYKVSSQIDTNYAGHEAAGSRKGDKVEELP